MLVTTFIKQHLPTINQALEKQLQSVCSDERKIIEEAILYSFAGGKRLRALLAIASFSLFDDDVNKILPLCSAIEMVHTYTLIHDDLPSMDDDDYRRGQLTNHKKFGEGVAILAGDTLHTYAFEILISGLSDFYSPETVLLVVKGFARVLGKTGIVGGQVLDIKGDKSKQDYEYLKKMHQMKTGTLISAALTLPFRLLGRSEKEIEIMKSFGDSLGLLFQIVDDILDYTGTTEVLGKTANKDQEENKLTYVSLFGLEGARKKEQEIADRAKSVLVNLDRNNSVLEGFVDYVIHRCY